jgi:hypothetical protein
VEGWAQYYEYFHKLNTDMQQTSEASAQRRSCSDVKFTLKPTNSTCFDAIALCIEASDKHIVRIADGDGSTTQSAVEGSRTLCEADLVLVRAQLRAAAQSSSLHDSEAQEELLAQTAQDIESAVLTQLGGNAQQQSSNLRRSGEPSACAAAIETLLWFGLALGEPPRSLQQLEMLQDQEWNLPGLEPEPVPRGGLEVQVPGDEATFPLSSEFDWEQAASEAGLDDEVQTPLTKDELQAAFGKDEVQTPRPPLLAKGSQSQDSLHSEVTTCPIERFDSSSSANSEGDSRAESVFSDFNDCSSETGPSECGQLNEAEASCSSVVPTSPSQRIAMLDDMEDGAPYCSPQVGSDRRCSRREARPPKQWDSQVEAPLLKWEKEQQQPRSKRRAVKRPGGSKLPAGSEVDAQGADTYETDSSEDLATQLGLPSTSLEPEGCFMLLADCTPAKRQRNAHGE